MASKITPKTIDGPDDKYTSRRQFHNISILPIQNTHLRDHKVD